MKNYGARLLSLALVLALLVGLFTVVPAGAAVTMVDVFNQKDFNGFLLDNPPAGWSLVREGSNAASTSLMSVKDGKLNLELKDADGKGGNNYHTLTRTFDPVTGDAVIDLSFTTNFGSDAEAPDNGASYRWFGIPGYFYLQVVNAHMKDKLIRVYSWEDEPANGVQAFYIKAADGGSYHMTASVNPVTHVCSFVFTDGNGANVTRYDPKTYQPATETSYVLKPAADGAQIPTSIGNLFFSSKANAKSGKFNIDIQSVGLKTLESDLPDGYFIQENFNGSEMPLDWTLSPTLANSVSVTDGRLTLQYSKDSTEVTVGKGGFSAAGENVVLEFVFNKGAKDDNTESGRYGDWFTVPGLMTFQYNDDTLNIRGTDNKNRITYGSDIKFETDYKLVANINTKTRRVDINIYDVQTGAWVKPWSWTHDGTPTLYNDASDQEREELHYLQADGAADTPLTSLSFMTLAKTMLFTQLTIDSVKLYIPQAPVVDSLTVTGMTGSTGRIGDELRAEAVISDADGDPLGQASYQWYRSANGQEPWTKIEGADGQTYFCTNDDLNQYIRAGVTPVSTMEPTHGQEAFSDPVGPVEQGDIRPVAGTVTIEGAVFVNNTLTAKYDFFSPAGKEEGTSSYSWEIADSEDGSYTAVANTRQYTPQAADESRWLRVSVTPVDEDGLAGEPKTSVPALISGEYQTFYVATNGSDENDGSLEAPFATIEHARDVVRSLDKKQPVKVMLRGGVYRISSKILFDSRDSGTEECPITYCAYGDETVTFSGSTKLDVAKAVKVTDPAILDRVIDENAREKLMMIDLGAQGIDSIEAIKDGYGDGYWNSYPEMSVFYDGLELTPARWPNDGFLRVNKVDVDSDNFKTAPFTLHYEDTENRARQWSKEALANLYIGDRNSFSFQAHQVASVDADNNSITSKAGSNYIVEPRCMFYFFNLLDEIDIPGESYMDRENRILYYYPPNDNALPAMEINTLGSEIVSLDGVSYVNFEGLRFDGSKQQLFVAKDIDNVNINGCEFSRCSSAAVNITRGTNVTLENSHIYDTGAGGINLWESGDRVSLTSGNVVIRNNRIHHVDRIVKVYVPAIRISGSVGTLIENNELYDAKQSIVNLDTSNDIQFNYNEIYDAMNWFDDMSAVYYGRDATMLGIEFKYNFFHDIGNPYDAQYGTHSLFWDDGAAGPLVYGNIFYRGTNTNDNGGDPKTDNPLKTYYGQKSRVENNIIVDAPSGFGYSTYNYINHWMLFVYSVPNYDKGWKYWEKLEAVNYDSDTWKTHYQDTQWSWLNEYIKREYKQQLDAMSQADKDAFEQQAHEFARENLFPEEGSNVFSKNILAQVDVPIQVPSWAEANIKAEQNYNMSDAETGSAFVEYGKDFRLTDAALAKVRQTIPDFENIPTDRIGLQTYQIDGKELSVGGSAPAASNLSLSTEAIPGAVVRANYEYTDPDSDREGYSKITWYAANTENGKYQKIETPYRDTLTIGKELVGKYIRYTVQPVDNRGIRGEAVQSASYQVADTANALLSDILVDGQSLKGFLSNKFSYSMTVETVPEVIPVLSDKNASFTIDKAESIPSKTVVHVTARDGVSKQDYTIQWKSKSTPTPTPYPTGQPYDPNYNNNRPSNPSYGSGSIIGSMGNGQQSNVNGRFTDCIGHWAQSDIEEMTKQGIVTGVTVNTFEPDREITRAEFATLVAKALNLTSTASAGFSDVASESWYYTYVNAAANAGLIAGYDGLFRPDDLITREEMAVIIAKAYSFAGGQSAGGGAARFADADSISSWAYASVDATTAAGLISGMTADTFAPAENATRAQAASLMRRLFDKI